MSSFAVFLILGGATAFAAIKKVGANEIKANSIKTGKIVKEAVTAGKIKKAAVTEGKIADGAVTTNKLANDAVTGDKVNESTLGKVPNAVNADHANTANTASTVSAGAITPASISGIPAVRVFSSVSQPLPNGTPVTLNFNTENFDTANVHSTTVDPSRLTAPITGIYRISASIGFTIGAGRARVDLIKNGTTLIFNTQNPTAGDNTFLNSTDLVQLNAGEFVEVKAQQNSGAASTAFSCSPAGACPSFSMEWVAPS
jgi:hypothetical protein